MLIPQFSLRMVLLVTTGLGLIFLVFAQAARGQPWAIGVTIAAIGLVIVLLFHAVGFLLIWLFAQFQSLIRGAARLNPKQPARNETA